MFASRRIVAGETVEVAPVIQLRVRYDVLDLELQRRIFHWGRLASRPGIHALALGYGSMYNHSNPANLRYSAENDAGAIRFVAVRDFEANEELTINYDDTGGAPESTEDNWFKTVGIAPCA